MENFKNKHSKTILSQSKISTTTGINRTNTLPLRKSSAKKKLNEMRLYDIEDIDEYNTEKKNLFKMGLINKSIEDVNIDIFNFNHKDLKSIFDISQTEYTSLSHIINYMRDNQIDYNVFNYIINKQYDLFLFNLLNLINTYDTTIDSLLLDLTYSLELFIFFCSHFKKQIEYEYSLSNELIKAGIHKRLLNLLLSINIETVYSKYMYIIDNQSEYQCGSMNIIINIFKILYQIIAEDEEDMRNILKNELNIYEILITYLKNTYILYSKYSNTPNPNTKQTKVNSLLTKLVSYLLKMSIRLYIESCHLTEQQVLFTLLDCFLVYSLLYNGSVLKITLWALANMTELTVISNLIISNDSIYSLVSYTISRQNNDSHLLTPIMRILYNMIYTCNKKEDIECICNHILCKINQNHENDNSQYSDYNDILNVDSSQNSIENQSSIKVILVLIHILNTLNRLYSDTLIYRNYKEVLNDIIDIINTILDKHSSVSSIINNISSFRNGLLLNIIENILQKTTNQYGISLLTSLYKLYYIVIKHIIAPKVYFRNVLIARMEYIEKNRPYLKMEDFHLMLIIFLNEVIERYYACQHMDEDNINEEEHMNSREIIDKLSSIKIQVSNEKIKQYYCMIIKCMGLNIDNDL